MDYYFYYVLDSDEIKIGENYRKCIYILTSMLIVAVAFVAFPESKEAIISNENMESVNVESSGSIGLYRDGVCHKTDPNETLISNERFDWCLNVANVNVIFIITFHRSDILSKENK
jgi:hypothetical protein